MKLNSANNALTATVLICELLTTLNQLVYTTTFKKEIYTVLH